MRRTVELFFQSSFPTFLTIFPFAFSYSSIPSESKSPTATIGGFVVAISRCTIDWLVIEPALGPKRIDASDVPAFEVITLFKKIQEKVQLEAGRLKTRKQKMLNRKRKEENTKKEDKKHWRVWRSSVWNYNTVKKNPARSSQFLFSENFLPTCFSSSVDFFPSLFTYLSITSPLKSP